MVLSLFNKRTGKRFPLEESATLLGRDPKLRLCLNDVGVSRRHAVLLRTEDGVLINDLGSRNGVFVNGVLIEANGATPLGQGDRITIGGTTFLLESVEGEDLLEQTMVEDLDDLDGLELLEDAPTDDLPADELPGLGPACDTGTLDAVLSDLEGCFDDGFDDGPPAPIAPGVIDAGDSAELILDPDIEL